MKAYTVAVMVALLGCAATAEITPIPDGAAFDLSYGTTYTYGATVTYVPAGAAGLTIEFGVGPTPPATPVVLATVVVDEGVPDSPFHGDYIDRSINTFQFGFTGSGYVPALAALVLESPTRSWSYDFRSQVSVVTGEQRTVQISLSVTGWVCNVYVPNKGDAFAQDLRAIQSVKFVLTPNANVEPSPAQTYTIADVILVNDDGLSSKPGALTPLEEALLARFGFGYGKIENLTDEMKSCDTDGDGMFDYIEIWAENDEAYADSIFAAEDIQVLADGVEITWTCVNGEIYTVLRSDSLSSSFLPVAALMSIQATDTGYMTRKDESVAGEAGPFYYRIRKD